jgi:hypothetical protein
MSKVASDCEALERSRCDTVVEYVVGRGAVGLPITGHAAEQVFDERPSTAWASAAARSKSRRQSSRFQLSKSHALAGAKRRPLQAHVGRGLAVSVLWPTAKPKCIWEAWLDGVDQLLIGGHELTCFLETQGHVQHYRKQCADA